jgi:CBS domain-containing protein
MTEGDPRQTPESITQATTIEEADRILRMQPVVVRASASLAEVAERAVDNPGCRVIAVVDDDDRLVGVLPTHALVNEVFQKIVPEEFLGEITDLEAALEYASRIGARTAADLMSPPVSVHSDENVRTAFERMHTSSYQGLPITDREEHVLGYVDQLELLVVWVHATGRESLLQPTDRASTDDSDR